jgi:hypothetical protein
MKIARYDTDDVKPSTILLKPGEINWNALV